MAVLTCANDAAGASGGTDSTDTPIVPVMIFVLVVHANVAVLAHASDAAGTITCAEDTGGAGKLVALVM